MNLLYPFAGRHAGLAKHPARHMSRLPWHRARSFGTKSPQDGFEWVAVLKLSRLPQRPDRYLDAAPVVCKNSESKAAGEGARSTRPAAEGSWYSWTSTPAASTVR